GQFSHALFVHALEVDFGQVQGRQGGAVDGISHVGTQVGVQHGGANNAKQRIKLFGRNVGCFKDTSLGGLNQVQYLVLDTGSNGNSNGGFVHGFGQTLPTHV